MITLNSALLKDPLMLIDVDSVQYAKCFPNNPHPFISEGFIDLNRRKVERIIRLVSEGDKPTLGFVAGVLNGVLRSPFSAPFGGFHFRNGNIYISEIENFIVLLKRYTDESGLKGVDLVLPPDIYHSTVNAKLINVLFRNGFVPGLPEITNWVNLREFTGEFAQKNSREYYRQAVRNSLCFDQARDYTEHQKIYDLIAENRSKHRRPIYMTLDGIIGTSVLWPVDFFKVTTADDQMAASAIFYRAHPTIAYAVFWGDSDNGRPLRAMDFLANHLWTHYKSLGYEYLDMGISTESGHPNEGLLRFKESHDCKSSLRFSWSWRGRNN